ncbi:glycosyltransferase family 4 protein [Notoacmeibacter sp. MSK16QG-6]|uniref:glycosyltransferase family 4 protein n=1 Tax=Notoacmeibacter sp. MSK16QG-6 TaxID=2957982 RepID=UPI00209D70FA|nr:glycosyltransferase family 4 protein [Notoacmeibacter sp. MSK16QG-6]MCP1199838.1 glycosyltransferase family 4 protein [Notoacmeibacter sp. MSK16QG-6]
MATIVPETVVPDEPLLAVAPNLKKRLSGVTATIARLVPLQAIRAPVAAYGPGLPADVPIIGTTRLLLEGYRQRSGQPVFHARRNTEMLLGVILRDLLRGRWKLLFTSASQRQHTAYSRFLISRMDHIIATSAAGQAYLKVPSEVVHHGIDIGEFSPPEARSSIRGSLGLPDRPTIGCFGRIRRQKGTDVFVDAMIALLADRPTWQAIVLGRATDAHEKFLNELKEKVGAAGLADRILFPPEVPVDQIPRWYKALDIFVAPQRWEGFGLTVLEALATGVPTVATRVGAFPELIAEGETGFLIEPADENAMIGALAPLMDNDEMREAMAACARTYAKRHFSIESEVETLLAIYRRLSNESGVSAD